MILSNVDIQERLKKGDLKVEPIEPHQVGPCSVDVRLGNVVRSFKLTDHTVIDPKTYDDPKRGERLLSGGGKVEIHEYTDAFHMTKPFVLHPRDFVLGGTHEWIEVPDDLGCRIEGRSSLGRIGVIVHATAGWVDPGFKGTLTLEITNIGKVPVRLYPGMRIGQLLFYKLLSPSTNPYHSREHSKYTLQTAATESRLGQDKEFKDWNQADKQKQLAELAATQAQPIQADIPTIQPVKPTEQVKL